MTFFGGSLPLWCLTIAFFALSSKPIDSFSIGSILPSNSDSGNAYLSSKSINEIISDESICAKTCTESTENNRNSIVRYESGKTYTYQVELSTRLNKAQWKQQSMSTKVQIKALADLSIYKSCEAVIRLRNVQISGIDSEQEASQMKSQLESQSTHFSIENGQIGHVCSESDESEWTLNIKKSILSAIQMSAKNINEKSSVVETDINGQCKTDYEPVNQWAYGLNHDERPTIVVLKTKQLAKCNKRHQLNFGLFPRSYGLNQMIHSSMPLINSTYECRQKIQSGIVVDTKCCDKQTIWPLNIVVDSDIHAQLVDETKSYLAPKSINKQLKQQDLSWTSSYNKNYYQKSNQINSIIDPSSQKQYTVRDVQQLVQQVCSQVQGPVQIEVPEMFSELVRAKQYLTVQEEQQIWQQISTGSVCQSPKIVDIYLDASALSGTEGSVEVLIQAYQQYQQQQQSQQTHPDVLPRFSYLFSLLGFAKYPTIKAGQRLVQFVQQQQEFQQYQTPEYEQIIYGVTGYIHNIRQYQLRQGEQRPTNQQGPVITEQDVDQLVYQIQQVLVEKLEQCVQKMTPTSEQVNVTTCLTWIQGIDNVGIYIPSQYQQQQQLVQRLVQVYETLKTTPEYVPIRVAVIRSMIDAVADDQQTRQYLMQNVFLNEQEPTVVRIEAYRTLVLSSPKITELEQIRQYTQQVQDRYGDLVQYVRSHQDNLRTTSDIHRRSILPLGAPEFEKPLVGAFDMSRNYEFSYLNQVYQIGVTAEGDVIYGDREQQSGYSYNKQRRTPFTTPQVVEFNLTVPVMGHELQAVKVRVEQTGLDQVVSQKLREYQNRIERMDAMTVAQQLISVATEEGQKLLDQNPEFRLYVQVSVDGKTVMLLDQRDLINILTGNGQVAQFFQGILNRGQQQVSIDRAFAVIPVDFVAGMTTTNGLPVQVQVNSSVVVGLKSDITVNLGQGGQGSELQFALWPSVSGQIETRVQYHTGSHAKSIVHKARVYSAPHVNLYAQVGEEEGVTFKWTMPEAQYTLVRYEYGFYVNEQGTSSSMSTRTPSFHKKQCTDFTKKPFGVAICYDVSYQNEQEYAEFVSEVTVEKYDQTLNSFEVHVDSPLKYWRALTGSSVGNKKRSLKMTFNTPGSQIDRELAFEVELPSFDYESGLLKEARLRIQTPWKQFLAQAIARNQENERIVSIVLSVDRRQLVAMELGLENVARGPKSEYRAKMTLASPIMRSEPINLVGFWSYQKGRKSQLYVSLEDVETKRQYIKATLIKTGEIQGDLKCSAHCVVDVAGVAAKVSGTFDRSAGDMKLDMNTDYQVFSRAHSARLTLNHKNLGTNGAIKMAQQGMWSCTQFPEYNIEYLHHLTVTPQQYFEHDLKMGWNNNEEQIRCYNMAKMQSQRGQYDVDAKSILVVRPLDINYEVNAKSDLVGWTTEGIKSYQFVAEGHERDQPQKGKINAEISYQRESQSPLKMKMSAALKSESIDLVYSDYIQEQQPNQLHGHMLVQLTPQVRYAADYVYSIENDKSSDEYRHKYDVTLIDDISKQLKCKQSYNVRYAPYKSLDVQSKWTGEHEQNVFDGQLSLNRYTPSKCQFSHYPSDSEADIYVDVFSTQQPMAHVQMKSGDCKHQTDVSYEKAKKLFKLNSQTKQNERNILSIDSEIAPEYDSRVKIDSDDMFSSHCQYDDSSKDRKMARIAVKLPESWDHETKIYAMPRSGRFDVKSQTQYKDSSMADIVGKYDGQQKQFNVRVNTPKTYGQVSVDDANKKYDLEFKNEKFEHQSKLDCGSSSSSSPNTIQFESKTLKNGKNVATVKYDCGNDQVHQFNVDCDDYVKAKGECKWQTNEPYGNVNVDWIGQYPFKHESTIFGNRQDKSWNFDSKTKLSDEKIAKIKAAIAKKSSKSEEACTGNLAIDIPQFEADLDYDKCKENIDDEQKISFGFQGKSFAPEVKHRTQVKIQKRSIVDLKSETTKSKDKSNYLKIQSQYRHNDQNEKSNFDVHVGQFLQAMGKFNFFNENEKSFEMNGEYRDEKTGNQYKHQSDVKYLPKESTMKIDSKISDAIGNKIASLQSYITNKADKTSYIKTESKDTKKFPRTKIEINPRMKRAAIDFDMDPIKHQTIFHDDNTAMKFETMTSKNQQNIFNFNTEVSHDTQDKSHVKVQVGPKYQTEVSVHPAQRYGSFSFQTPTIRHGSQMRLNPNTGYGQPSTIQSTTHYRDDMLADIDARLEGLRGENVIKANVPSWIRLDSTVDLPGRRVSFDAQSDRIGRRAMGSVYASHTKRNSVTGTEGHDLHFDLAWDVDRDPRSRVLVEVSARRQQDQTVVINTQVDYAHNRFYVNTEMNPGNVWNNGAMVSVGYTPYNNIDSWQVIYTHVNHLPQVECKVELFVNGQVQYAVRVTNQVTGQRFVLGFQTTSPKNIESQINVNVMGVDQGQGQYYMKVNVQRAIEDQYELEATAQQDPDYQIYFGKIEIRFPRVETQTVEYRVDLPGRHINVHMVSPQTGKEFKLVGDIQNRLAQLLVKSDVPYLPMIDGKVRYVPSEEVYTSLVYNNQRLVEAQYKQTGLDRIGSGGLYVLAKWQSVWTPTYEWTVQSSTISTPQPTTVITVQGKYNAEKVLYLEMKQAAMETETYGKQSMTIDMSGWISRPNGVRLLETVSKVVIGTDSEDQALLTYVLDIVPNSAAWPETVEPIYVSVTGTRKPGQTHKVVGQVKIQHGHERRDWIDADVVMDNIHYVVYQIPVPERVLATVRYVPTSTQATLAISFMETLDETVANTYGQRVMTLFDDQNVLPQLKGLRVVRKYRNQILATLDDRKIGFEVVSSLMGKRNTLEHSVKLYSPQRNGRSIHYRTAYHIAPETFTYFYRNELKSGYEQQGPIYESTVMVAPVPEKPTSYMFFYDLQSPMVSGDGHVWTRAFFFGPENQYQGVVATVRTTSQDEITFEATTRTEEVQSNQYVYYGQSNKKTYYNVTVYSADRKIDTGVDGHVAGYGFHVNWHNQNRHGQRKTGTYRFELVGQDQFEATVEYGHHGYQAKGQIVPNKQNIWIADIVVDEYKKVPTGEVPTGSYASTYYYGRQITQQKQSVGTYKVHVEGKDQCIRADIENEQQPTNVQQLSLCMDVDQSNVLNLAIDSIVDGRKTTDLNVRLDTSEVVNSVVLSLKWNPSYQQTLMGQLVDRMIPSYDQYEIVEEVKHIVTVLVEKIIGHRQAGIAQQYQTLIDEMVQIIEDFGIDVSEVKSYVRRMVIRPIIYTIQEVIQTVYDYVSIVDEVTQWVQKVYRSVQNQCYNSKVCYNVINSFSSFDSIEQLIDVVSERIVRSLQHTHRIVSTSYTGRWIRSLLPSTYWQYMPQFIHQVNYYITNWYTKMIAGNYPLAEFVNNIEHIVHQMMDATQWHQVEWDQVKTAVEKIVQMTISPVQFVSTKRVLIYDPQQGRLQVELYGPAVQHPRYYQQKYNDIVKRGTTYYPSSSNQSWGGYGYSSYYNPTSATSGSSSIWNKIFPSTY